MGGVFSSKPKIEVVQPVEDTSAQDAEEARKEALARQRRGMESTIRTSYTGTFDPTNRDLNRKTLLGE